MTYVRVVFSQDIKIDVSEVIVGMVSRSHMRN